MNEETKLIALRLWAKTDIASMSKYDCFEAGWDEAMVKFRELIDEYKSDDLDPGSSG